MNDNYQPREKAYKRFLNYKNTSGIRAGPGGRDQTLAVKNNNFNLIENNLLVLQCKTIISTSYNYNQNSKVNYTKKWQFLFV